MHAQYQKILRKTPYKYALAAARENLSKKPTLTNAQSFTNLHQLTEDT